MGSDLLILIPVFFFIAMVYSSAGFGGGTSYLAVFAFLEYDFLVFRPIALMCNIAVVSGSVWIFYQKGFLKIRKILPLVLLSIPFAFLGGLIKIEEEFFFILLGFTLLIASILMMISKSEKAVVLPKYTNATIGGGIGFLSGIVGIGGGVFLSPLLHLSRWAEVKVIAATTAAFILVNSISGLAGQMITNGFQIEFSTAGLLLLAVILGGQIGARFTAGKVNPMMVRQITSIVILFVAIRLLWRYLPLVITHFNG